MTGGSWTSSLMTSAGPAANLQARSVVTEWFSTRAGGILVLIAATVLAFLIGGLDVLIQGSNPIMPTTPSSRARA